jgi:hypothetical protein
MASLVVGKSGSYVGEGQVGGAVRWFDDVRQDIINGIESAQAEAAGWDAEVKAKLAVTTVVRTSSTVVTVTLSAQAAYNITAQETITVTVPAVALTGAAQIVGTPTFTVAVTAGYTDCPFIQNLVPYQERLEFVGY